MVTLRPLDSGESTGKTGTLAILLWIAALPDNPTWGPNRRGQHRDRPFLFLQSASGRPIMLANAIRLTNCGREA